jgi:Xaa-Pro aminopeptidase
MNLAQRREAIRKQMAAEGMDLLFAFHDGTHFIEKPDPVTILSGFKGMDNCVAALPREGEPVLFVSPVWDAERAKDAARGFRVVPVDHIVPALPELLDQLHIAPGRVGLAGLSELSWQFGIQVRAVHGGQARIADSLLYAHAKRKTDDEIAHAREAVRIAEKGYEHFLKIARPGMSEYELAAEIRWYTKTLGADDNFFLMCASPHNRAVQPSSGRKLEAGDIILAEITPSYHGQLAQICRTVSVGEPSDLLRKKYALVVDAMEHGIAAAKPGAQMSAVCDAINKVLEAEGYGEYCFPPHIRRRGHGLGFASILPGDVALDNKTVLEPDMFFVIHPNQYLPETGYLLCGEPTLVTEKGPEPLTKTHAALAQIEA